MSPFFAMALLVTVLFCGLAVDSGRMEMLKAQMQNASDAAAVGAELASEAVVTNVNVPPSWQTQGQLDAALNGFTNGAKDASGNVATTVTVIQNPTSGEYAGRYDAIQVTITQTFHTLFLGVLHGGTWTVTTQSVALAPPCAYFLGNSNALDGGSTFSIASGSFMANCPLYVNYNQAVDGFSKGWGFGFDVSGTAGASSGASGWTSQWMEEGFGGDPPQQPPTYGVPVRTDPLLGYIPTEPSFSGTCYMTNYSISGSASATLNPPPLGAAYCGTYNASTKVCTPGLKITSTGTVTLNPGLYVFTCGIAWNNGTVSGTGVTLYFTNPSQGSGVGFGQVLIGRASLGNAENVALSAPTSSANGGIPAILFFLDRNWVTASTTSDKDFILDTYSTFAGDGIWYMPRTGFYSWLGSFTVPTYFAVVANDTYLFGGQLIPTANFSWLSGGSPFRTQGVLVQ